MRFFSSLILALLVPALLFAQGNTLRSQIRADLTADPRSQQMSQAELDALVEAIATQAEADGSAAAYLDGQNSFDYSAEFAAAAAEEPVTSVNTSLILAVVALGIVLLSVALYIVRRKGTPEAPSDIGA